MFQIYLCLFFSVISSVSLLIFSLLFPLHMLYFIVVYVLFIIVSTLMLFRFIKKVPEHNIPYAKSITVNDEVATKPQDNNQSDPSDAFSEKLRYEALLANIGEGLVVTNKKGEIITFNKAAVSMLGWTEQEAVGKAQKDIIGVEYNTEKKPNVGTQPTFYFIRRDKTKFPVAITVTSYVQGSTILGTITLFRDITTEQNVDAIKNEFIGLASHQLRTPLSAIKWYTDMLIKGDAGALLPEQLEYTKNVYASTERMIQLVNALLNISRIESGRLSIEPSPTDIKKLIEEVVQEVTIRYKDKKHKIKVTVPDQFPHINVDPRLIRQVYLNLLTNAIKYTPENGEIMITVSQIDSTMVSAVKDNGYGIPENEQAKIFDKFYRGTNVVEKIHDGTGLGLYLIKAIIELSHGKIWYKSHEGHGTTFYFSLPLSGTQAIKGAVTLNS